MCLLTQTAEGTSLVSACTNQVQGWGGQQSARKSLIKACIDAESWQATDATAASRQGRKVVFTAKTLYMGSTAGCFLQACKDCAGAAEKLT